MMSLDRFVPETNTRLFLSKAVVGELEEKYVIRALRSGWLAPAGPDLDAFEEEIAARVGVKYGVGLSSGTAALHLLLESAGARQGTTVLLPSMTFAATANAVAYTGAQVAFVDSDPTDGNVDPLLLAEAADDLKLKGHRVVAVVPVDLFGRMVDYQTLLPLMEERGIAVVEDAAESLGASSSTGMAGAQGVGGAISFNGNKILSTSGGGMLVTNKREVAERARYLSTQARQPLPWYEHTEVGYNYRLSNILAAVGRAQLVRLDEMISRRRAIRDQYEAGFADIEGLRLIGRGGSVSDLQDNCWLTSIVLDIESFGLGPQTLVEDLERKNIECRPLWKPMHMQPVYSGAVAYLNGSSERLFASGLNLPSGAGLTRDDVARVISAVRGSLKRA